MFKDIHEFLKLIDRIDYCVQLYENKYMRDNEFELYLSNGDEIKLFYSENSLPHLLGIDINFLRSTDLYTGSAWEILMQILENPNKLYNQMKNGHIRAEQVFSDYIDEKLENFENICGINVNKIEFIVKYDKEKTYSISNTSFDGEYYIGIRSDYNTLSVVGFTKNKDFYNPITNLKFHYYRDEKDEFLKKLLENQTLTTLQSLIKKKYIMGGKVEKLPLYHTNVEKEKKLQLLSNYAESYGAVCDTHKDSIYFLNKNMNLYKEMDRVYAVFSEVTEIFQAKKLVNIPKLEKKHGEMEKSLIDALSAYNDSLTSEQNSDQNNSYGELIEELKKFQTEAHTLANKVSMLDEKCKNLQVENAVLKGENAKYKEVHENIRVMLNKVNA